MSRTSVFFTRRTSRRWKSSENEAASYCERRIERVAPCRYLFRIEGHLPVRRDEEDVLWLQIRVCELAIVQELDRVADLVGDVTNLVQRVRMIIIIFLKVKRSKVVATDTKLLFRQDKPHEEVKDAEAKELKGETHVPVVVEPGEQSAAKAARDSEQDCIAIA